MSTPIAYTPAYSVVPLIAALPAQTNSMTEWVLTHHTA